ncbi:hypothetical protein, partial [Rhodococcus qingshengii]|uniref:hypothetical protein n=1 Tax=Rhodococcus qingshengii TaxID=334542 RepID=UPI001C8C18BF
MTEEIWRPLGFDAAEDPTFDVLRDDVPPWLEKSLRTWIMGRFVRQHMGRGVGGKYQYFLVELLRKAERQLRFSVDYDGGITAVDRWGNALFHNLHDPTTQWRLVDFLLAESGELRCVKDLGQVLVGYAADAACRYSLNT